MVKGNPMHWRSTSTYEGVTIMLPADAECLGALNNCNANCHKKPQQDGIGIGTFTEREQLARKVHHGMEQVTVSILRLVFS